MERRGGSFDLRRGQSASLIVAAWPAIVGCGETNVPREPPAAVREAATGGQSYVDESNENATSLNGCTPFDRSVIRQAGIYMRTLSGFSDYFRECLRDSVLDGAPFVLGGRIGPYLPCPSDPLSGSSREDQLQQAFTTRLFPNRLIVGCGFANGGGGVTAPGDIGPWSKGDSERFELSQTQIDQASSELQLSQGTQTLELLAGLMLHEAYHNHGYLHEPPGSCPGQQKGTNDMPDIVQMCIQKASLDRTMSPTASCSGECRAGGHLVIPDSFASDDGTCVCEQELGATQPGARGDDPPQKTDFSNAATDAAGTVLARGNFDGDFYDDLAVSVPGEQKVEIYYGTVWGLVRLRDIAEDALDRTEAEDRFGAALAVEDFDDDGFDDIAIGAPGEDDGEGRVYVYRGSLRGLEPSQTLFAFDGPHAGDGFGAALTTGFDGDRRSTDGRFDRFLAVGAPRRSSNGAATGAVYVFVDRGGGRLADPRLSPFSNVTPPARHAEGAEFGAALATGTRLPVDPPAGEPDAVTATRASVVVGAPGASESRGRAYLYDGSWLARDGAPRPEATMQVDGIPAGARFGSAVAFGQFGTLGPKVFVGSPGADRVDRFDADVKAQSPGAHEDSILGPPGRQFGASLAGLQPSGNLAGLLFVGAPGDDSTAPLGGYVAIYGTEGTKTVTVDRLTQTLMSESQGGDRFGTALALGNFDHDAGNLAVAVGAPGDCPSGLLDAAGSGAVFTFKQSPDPCRKFLGWKVHTDSGRIWHTVSPFIPAKHRPIDGKYRAGDRVISECNVFQALVDDPGSDLTDITRWELLDLTEDSVAPTATSPPRYAQQRHYDSRERRRSAR